MKKIIRVVGIVIGVLILIGAGIYLYVFHKPHRDISSEEAAYKLQSTELSQEYVNNRNNADSVYLDEAIVVSGKVEEVDSSFVKLEGGIYCNLIEGTSISEITEGADISLKGRVVSYDELFEEVRMDNCEVVQ